MTDATRWTAADLPDLEGRTAVVPGASGGLGLVTAAELARAGATVVLAVRDPEKGARAATAMTGHTEVRPLDLASLTSVREFAAGWSGDLDILVNNAGIMLVPEGRTEDGFELHMGTNRLGPFALTNLLLPHITRRVVNLSSQLQNGGRVRLDDLQGEHRRYNALQAYRGSELANTRFTLELQRRLSDAGSSVRAVTAHPGIARTNLAGHVGGVMGSGAESDGEPVQRRRPRRAARRCTRPPRTSGVARTSARTGSTTSAATPRCTSWAGPPGTPRRPAGCGTSRPRLTATGFHLSAVSDGGVR